MMIEYNVITKIESIVDAPDGAHPNPEHQPPTIEERLAAVENESATQAATLDEVVTILEGIV